MPLHYKPKSEKELNRYPVLPEGDYPFTVLESDEVASKSPKNAGKIMVKLKLNVHGPDFDKHVFDYFADWFSEWKLKHFLEAIGRGADYESGQIDARENAYEGRTGYVRIIIEENKETGEDRNAVDDYIVQPAQKVIPKLTPTSTALAPAPAAHKELSSQDDVPF